jgi:hypothetical protein
MTCSLNNNEEEPSILEQEIITKTIRTIKVGQRARKVFTCVYKINNSDGL